MMNTNHYYKNDCLLLKTSSNQAVKLLTMDKIMYTNDVICQKQGTVWENSFPNLSIITLNNLEFNQFSVKTMLKVLKQQLSCIITEKDTTTSSKEGNGIWKNKIGKVAAMMMNNFSYNEFSQKTHQSAQNDVNVLKVPFP